MDFEKYVIKVKGVGDRNLLVKFLLGEDIEYYMFVLK